MNAFCVVSDSGTLPEEASYFNTKGYPFPAVCIRTSTERPEALASNMTQDMSFQSKLGLAKDLEKELTELGKNVKISMC